MDNNEKTVTQWVESMVENGFLSGWCGDKSQSFKDEQIKYMLDIIEGKIEIGRHRLVAILIESVINLQKYCGWDIDKTNDIINMFGFTNIKQVRELCSKSPGFLKSAICNNKYIGVNNILSVAK